MVIGRGAHQGDPAVRTIDGDFVSQRRITGPLIHIHRSVTSHRGLSIIHTIMEMFPLLSAFKADIVTRNEDIVESCPRREPRSGSLRWPSSTAGGAVMDVKKSSRCSMSTSSDVVQRAAPESEFLTANPLK